VKQRKPFTVFLWLTQIILSELVRFKTPLPVRNPSTSHSSNAEKIKVRGFWENKRDQEKQIMCQSVLYLTWAQGISSLLERRRDSGSLHKPVVYSQSSSTQKLSTFLFQQRASSRDTNSPTHAAERVWFCSKTNSEPDPLKPTFS